MDDNNDNAEYAKSANKTPSFLCKLCDFTSNKKSDYLRHVNTKKHMMVTNDNNGNMNGNNLHTKNTPLHECSNCNAKYKHASGLSRHKKICTYIYTYTNENTVVAISDDQTSTSTILVEKQDDMPDMKELIIALMTQNQNMQKQMLEMMPQLGNTTNNNTMSNSHNNNKTNNFNVNMFLNEHCQNAMNISDFIESLPITHKELDNTRKYGLSESISNMVIKGLDDMSIYERPIHCTDPSRKTVYVRDNDEWVKDDNNVIMQRNAVRLAVKQRNNVKLWRDQYLEGKESDRTHLDYHDMALNCLKYIETDEKEKNKIVKKICQATHLTVDVKQKLMAIH